MTSVSGTIVCGVCGTVNVGVFARCIACGQELEATVLVKAVKLYLGKHLDVYWGVVKEV